MSKFKNITLTQFFQFLRNLPVSRIILYTLYFILIFLYPGQNQLQTISLVPGSVKSYLFDYEIQKPYPNNDDIHPGKYSARGIVIQDVNNHTILYEKNADLSMIPASTTKIMTALVALDHWQDLETVITVKNEDRAIGQTIDLVRGEQLTIRSLLAGLLIHSGNDAALALAENFPGGYSAFVVAMNKKSDELHLDGTVYKNPSGVEQYGHVTTPRDLAILASIAMKNPVIASLAETKFKMIQDVTGTISHPLESTNELLGVVPGLKGLKTGWTTGAGECLVSYVDRDGHPIVVVVLNSQDRFGETSKLIDWSYSHHSWIVPEL